MASHQAEEYVNRNPPICIDCGRVFDVLMGVRDYDRIPILIAHITQCRLTVPLSLNEATEKANRLTAELEKLRQKLSPVSTRESETRVITHLDGDEKAVKKRKNVTNEDERRLLLENDPWTKTVAKTQITCKACRQVIQLDGRNGCTYYRYNWIKHKAGCHKIPLEEREAVKVARAGRRQANKGRRPGKSSEVKTTENPSTSNASSESMKAAETTLMAGPVLPSPQSLDQTPTGHITALRGSDDAEGSQRKKIKLENFDHPREMIVGIDDRLHSPYATSTPSAPDDCSRSISSESVRSQFFDTVLCGPGGITNPQLTDLK